MIESILSVAGFLALMCAGGYLVIRTIFLESWGWGIAAFGFWSVLVGAISYLDSREDAKGPCVQYETQMHYNAATKTMMPAKVCVLRGEWIE